MARRVKITRKWWYGPVGAIAVFEAVALSQKDDTGQLDHSGTFSRFTRWLFRTHCTPGKVTFTGAVLAFWWHIIDNEEF